MYAEHMFNDLDQQRLLKYIQEHPTSFLFSIANSSTTIRRRKHVNDNKSLRKHN